MMITAAHGAFVADGEALDDVGGVPGSAALGQALHRLVLGAGVVLGALVQHDGQDDADQAGPGRPHVERRRCQASPSAANRQVDVRSGGWPGKAGSSLRVSLQVG